MDKIRKYLANAGNQAIPPEVHQRAFNDLFARQALNSGGLAAGTTTTKPKLASQINALVGGQLVAIPAADSTISWVESGSTVLPTLTLTSSQVGGYILTYDVSGLYHALVISYGTNPLSFVFPTVPETHVAFGLILVNTSNAASFTAGTTALSAANVQLVNIVGPFAPTNLF